MCIGTVYFYCISITLCYFRRNNYTFSEVHFWMDSTVMSQTFTPKLLDTLGIRLGLITSALNLTSVPNPGENDCLTPLPHWQVRFLWNGHLEMTKNKRKPIENDKQTSKSKTKTPGEEFELTDNTLWAHMISHGKHILKLLIYLTANTQGELTLWPCCEPSVSL